MSYTTKGMTRDLMFKWKSIRDLLRTLCSSLLGFTLSYWLMVGMGMADKLKVAVGMTIFSAIGVAVAFFAWRRLVFYRKRYEALSNTPEDVLELL